MHLLTAPLLAVAWLVAGGGWGAQADQRQPAYVCQSVPSPPPGTTTPRHHHTIHGDSESAAVNLVPVPGHMSHRG